MLVESDMEDAYMDADLQFVGQVVDHQLNVVSNGIPWEDHLRLEPIFEQWKKEAMTKAHNLASRLISFGSMPDREDYVQIINETYATFSEDIQSVLDASKSNSRS